MEIGTVRQVSIVEEMRDAYLDYAMSVITARALPDVRDGLKPVQRRILYAMDDMGLRHNQPHRKSARIVGEVLGKYHPHSDSAVYDAMVRLAQDFSMRYPLVDGHGNFGSIDGDGAAAMRYTEARLAAIAEEMLVDIDKDTVDFVDNFDGSLKEPRFLPARLPNLLVNGGSGIAVGMATNIPPHNLAEVCDAVSFLIDHYDDVDDIAVDDLMRYIKGPDFPTGGTILGREGIVSAYATGKGRVVVRARAHTEDLKGGRTAIVVTELPYQVNKASLIERIADLVRNRRLETISDLRDESDRTGMRVVIELKRGADTQTTLNQLLKYTTMQSTFGVNMLALVDGEPRVLSLRRTLQLFVEHRREVITRRSQFELARARAREHVLVGLKIALDNLDEVIDTIRRSRDGDTAQTNLMRRFKLTEIQARAILDMPLRRLAALERRRVEEELAEVRERIAYLEDLLAHPHKILALIQQEMAELRQRYGDARRTHIAEEDDSEFSPEDLIPSEDVFVVLTQGGSIERVAARSYRARGRGSSPTSEDDPPLHVLPANSMDNVLFFTSRGRVCQEKVHQVPEENRQGRGTPLADLISLDNGETVSAMVAVPDPAAPGFILMATAQGKVKRSELSELSTARSSGMAAISLDEGDALCWAERTRGGGEVCLVTAQGKAIRFSEDDVRPMGRAAGGVNGMRLGKGDGVVAADLVRPGSELVIVTARGYAKRTPIGEYTSQSRGGSGVLTIDRATLKQGGPIVAARALLPEEDVILVSAEGLTLRKTAKELPGAARAARGARAMRLKASDRVQAIGVLAHAADDDSPPPVPEGGAEPVQPPEKPARKRSSTRRNTSAAKASAGKARKTAGTKTAAGKRTRRKAATGKSGAAKAASEQTTGEATRKRTSRKTSTGKATKAASERTAGKTTRRTTSRKTSTGKATKAASETVAGKTTRRRTSRKASTGKTTKAASETAAGKTTGRSTSRKASTGKATKAASETVAGKTTRRSTSRKASTGKTTKAAGERTAGKTTRRSTSRKTSTGGRGRKKADSEEPAGSGGKKAAPKRGSRRGKPS